MSKQCKNVVLIVLVKTAFPFYFLVKWRNCLSIPRFGNGLDVAECDLQELKFEVVNPDNGKVIKSIIVYSTNMKI